MPKIASRSIARSGDENTACDSRERHPLSSKRRLASRNGPIGLPAARKARDAGSLFRWIAAGSPYVRKFQRTGAHIRPTIVTNVAGSYSPCAGIDEIWVVVMRANCLTCQDRPDEQRLKGVSHSESQLSHCQ
jgi:hypothetical protein